MLVRIVAAYGVHVRTQDEPASKDSGKRKAAKKPARKLETQAAPTVTASVSILV